MFKYLYTNVHISTVHNSQKGKQIKFPSMDGWMGKQNIPYPYNGVSFSYKKQWNTDTCYNTDEPRNIMPSQRIQAQKVTYYMIPFIQ